MAAPTDVATLGGTAIAGGRVLEWIDKAAYACAVGWSGGYCVTAYVGNVNFARPIHSGDMVEVQARLVHTGRSSMHVEVTVSSADPQRRWSTRSPPPARSSSSPSAATDDPSRSTQWVPVTDDDQERDATAVEKTAVRADIEAAMAEQTYTEASDAPSATLRFLAAPTDVNWGGKTHGGTVMRWIDEAAYVCAAGWSGSDQHRRLFRRDPLLPADHDRPRRRGPGPAAAHRTQQHARLGACALGRPEDTRHAADDPLPDDFRGPGRARVDPTPVRRWEPETGRGPPAGHARPAPDAAAIPAGAGPSELTSPLRLRPARSTQDTRRGISSPGTRTG